MAAQATITGASSFRPGADSDTGNVDNLSLNTNDVFEAESNTVAQVRIDVDDKITTTTQEVHVHLMGGTFTVNTGTDVITTTPNHGLFVGDLIRVSNVGGGLPGGLSATANYYCVISTPAANTLTVSATKGGGLLDITTAGTGTHYWQYYGYLNLAYAGPTTGPRAAVQVKSNRTGESNDFTSIKGFMAQMIPTEAGELVKGTFTVDAGTDVITTSANHYKTIGQRIRFESTGTLPAGMLADTDYYVLTTPAANTMTVSATSGGSTLNITDAGTGTHSWKTMGDADAKGYITLGDPADRANFISVPLNLEYRPDADPPQAALPAAVIALPEGMTYNASFHLKVFLTADLGNQNASVLINLLGK